MSEFFIHRPILAIVVSLVTMIIGIVTLAFLPVSLFPNITPPEIFVSATDPGSDAVTVEQSIATPIEQQISGVDNELHVLPQREQRSNEVEGKL